MQVWLARCKPLDVKCAVKLVDLEKHEANLVRYDCLPWAAAARLCYYTL